MEAKLHGSQRFTQALAHIPHTPAAGRRHVELKAVGIYLERILPKPKANDRRALKDPAHLHTAP